MLNKYVNELPKFLFNSVENVKKYNTSWDKCKKLFPKVENFFVNLRLFSLLPKCDNLASSLAHL